MKPTTAFLFPGQGAQSPGMAADLIEAHPEARRVFEEGREILGRDFARLCREGPEEELNSTRASQPAIFLHSMAALEVLAKVRAWDGRFCRGMPAAAAAGLSLGEYSALVFAGSLEFEEALRLVGRRGELMQEACDAARGTMASVLGLAAERVEEIVARARDDGLRVGVANYNSPGQTVISGEVEAVDETVRRLEAAGARRAVRLKVAGAYHSELMAPATRKLEPLLRAAAIRKPQAPFFANVAGARLEDPEEIRLGLIRQVESPVRWRQSVAAMLEAGVRAALEIGPGQVLRGLLRGMAREVEVSPAGTAADLGKLAEKERAAP
jgi:[acyl-carrier-protein] S-malonyltransferase